MANRYDQVYSTLARRAVRQGVVDLETFAERALQAGMSEEALEARLLKDVDEGGPVFGKFLRSMGGAASSSVSAAEKQGEAVALAYAEELISMSEMNDILEDADPETMEAASEALSGKRAYTWIATLENTCHLCLPLHGKSQTLEQWEELGLDPRTIHMDEGWDERCECKCNLMPSDEIDDPAEVREPLLRQKMKTETGLKISGRTQRAVAQRDIERAIAARDKAMGTLEGRRTLREMGQVESGGKITVKERDNADEGAERLPREPDAA